MLDPEVIVALQGTLDTFALPDVLRLLASTKKIGRLRVTGDGGSGSLWVDHGTVVGGELLMRGAQAEALSEVLFNLLRFSHGSFTFETGSVPPSTAEQRDVESIIVEAELMLGEWRSLEMVVPSLDAWLSLTHELKGRDVVVDADRWRIIVTIGSGANVGEVGRRVGLGDLAVMRAVKEVIELGLVEVSVEAPASAASTLDEIEPLPTRRPSPEASLPAAQTRPSVTPESRTEPVDIRPDPPADEPQKIEFLTLDGAPTSGTISPDSFTLESIMGADVPVFSHDTPIAPPSITEMRNGLGAMHLSDEPGRLMNGADPLDDPSEIARQLANLSPRAAKAVAAAAKATTDEERDAALSAIEAEDDTINRGLLLRFLGAVDG